MKYAGSIGRGLALTLSLALLMVAPAAAQAKVVAFKGQGVDDRRAKLDFDLHIRADEGRPIKMTLEDIEVRNAKFTCPDAVARSNYSFFQVEPVKVDWKHGEGKFEGRYKTDFEIAVFEGRIVRRDSGELKAGGIFKAARSEGGLQFGACTTGRVQWKAHSV